MPPMPTASWRELHRPTKSECPKLFYCFAIERTNLDIKLTDLVVVWQCSLDRTGIIDTAREQRSSIDPSESSNQMRVLLEKLQQSLDSGVNSLSRSANSEAQIVYLKTDLDLPKPLRPLSWTFEMVPEDAAELAEQLLRPCLHEASIAKKKIESLIRVIKEKDHVLSRLMEKVDSSAIDLSLIFPGITGLRSRKSRITTEEARKHIPGMSDFDQVKWDKDFEIDSPYAGFHDAGMDNLVAGCERCPKHTVKQHADWLTQLPIRGVDNEVINTTIKQSSKRKPVEMRQNDTSTDTESDFERGLTPPYNKGAQRNEGRARDLRASDSLSPNEEKPRPVKRAKLGQVRSFKKGNESKTASRRTSISPEPGLLVAKNSTPIRPSADNVDTLKHDTDSETETASEAEVDAGSPSATKAPATTSPGNSHKHSQQPGKLGKLNPSSTKTHFESSPSSPAIENYQKHSPHVEPLASTSGSNSPSRGGNKINILRISKLSRESSRKRESTSSDVNSEVVDDKPGTSRSSRSSTERKRNKSSPDKAYKDTDQPVTPSRRLGHLKNGRSSSAASPDNALITPTRKKEDESTGRSSHMKPREHDTDTETASEDEASKVHGDQATEQRPVSTASTRMPSQPSSAPSPSLTSNAASGAVSHTISKIRTEPETTQDKANRRREELKKRLNTGGGGRKVRKF